MFRNVSQPAPMMIKWLAMTLCFVTTASVGYGAGAIGGADLQPLNEQPAMLNTNVFKDLNAASGSDAFGTNPNTNRRTGATAGRSNAAYPVPASSVPEPSATLLLALGLAGFGMFKLRRASKI